MMGMRRRLVLTLTDLSLPLSMLPQRHEGFPGNGRLLLLYQHEVDFPFLPTVYVFHNLPTVKYLGYKCCGNCYDLI